jgi:hypothetical protein
MSPVPPLGTGRRGRGGVGLGKTTGSSTEQQGGQRWWVDLVGVLTQWRLDHMVDLE